ncbi:shikimate kinase [Propionicicella superfundia]|uniref:shikimate kinase n=1 Tax=Propionicicella superfundia TaxID=348582 RepID=UPI0004274FEF|nr:shikimate kinase [Propionicicella superfundia]
MTTIAVVGAPGAGKTTIGRALATALGLSFVDVDARVEEVAGKPIAEIFVTDGEPHFRALEVEQTLAALTGPGVVSLGGGAVVSAEIRRALAGHTVVWLRVSAAQAARRAGLNASRPLLWGNLRSRLQTLLAERTPLYEEVATIAVDTDHTDPADVVASILSAVKEEP